MIYAGSCGYQIVDRGALLDGQQPAHIVHAEFANRLFEIDSAVLYPTTIQHGEDALSHGRDV